MYRGVYGYSNVVVVEDMIILFVKVEYIQFLIGGKFVDVVLGSVILIGFELEV